VIVLIAVRLSQIRTAPAFDVGSDGRGSLPVAEVTVAVAREESPERDRCSQLV
jgi:hypothetical protein